MNFTNYCSKYIEEVFENFQYLLDSAVVSSRSFDFEFKISVDLKQLNAQASVFSENFKTHGYINFFRVLRVKENDVLETLKLTYIYSFIKALYNGFYYYKLSETANLGVCYSGHCALFNILKSPNNSGFKNDLMLTYSIDLGSNSYKQALFAIIFKRYPRLRPSFITDLSQLGNSAYIIPEFETYLQCLNKDYYTRDHINRVDTNKFESGRHNRKSNNEEKETENKGKYLPDNKSFLYDNGKIEIMTLGGTTMSNIYNFQNSPVLNAFTNLNSSKLYFTPVNSGKTMKDNASFIFSKANFIRLNTTTENSNNIKNIYLSKSLSSSVDHLICNEVYGNTGIKCRFNTQITDNTELPAIVDFEDFISKIKEKGKELLPTLEEILEAESLEELINDTLERLLKIEAQ